MAETGQQVDDEEGHPANDEHAHDDAQRFGRLLLARQLAELAAEREVLLELMGARVTAAVGCRRRGALRGGGTAAGTAAAAAVDAQRQLHASAAGTGTRAEAAAAGARTAAGTGTGQRGRQDLGAQPLAPGLRHRGRVDPVVGEHHDQQRHVERYGGREDQVAGAVGKRARIGRHRFGAHQPPPDDGREADDAAAHPHGRDQPVRTAPAHLRRVRERVRDRPVPVQRDDAQVQYAGGAEQHVQRPPHVARVYAERPVVVEHLLDGAHRHHHQADQEVGERQRRDEIVGGRVQVPLADHGDDHQTVAEHGHHAEQHEQRGQGKPFAERGRPPAPGRRVRGPRPVVVVVVRRVRGAVCRRPVHRH